MNTTIIVVQGDWGYTLSFTLQDSLGNVFNLTGVTSLVFRTQRAGINTLNSSGSMSVISATAGTCSYTVQQDDFLYQGQYSAQIQANFSTGTTTFSSLTIDSLPKIPS
jgi:hypothetical protein